MTRDPLRVELPPLQDDLQDDLLEDLDDDCQYPVCSDRCADQARRGHVILL